MRGLSFYYTMLDYIIVGGGLSGLAFAERALNAGKKIHVFENDSLHSSSVAAGVYNPVILKRFSRLANAQIQLDGLHSFYGNIEDKLGIKLLFNLPIYRKFASIEEQNNWFVASERVGIHPFLDNDIITSPLQGIDSPFGFGLVNQTGFLDTNLYLDSYRQWLRSIEAITFGSFQYDELELLENAVIYQGMQSKHIVFCEGFGIKQNPYFKNLPLNGTKGEVLEIEVPGLELNQIVKSGVFILPKNDGNFVVGATYDWDDKTENISESALNHLKSELEQFLKMPYKVVGQKAGIRPTVKDRKPLIGTHPDHKQMHLLNGMGTRGVMLAPFTSEILFNHIESGDNIPESMNLMRFWNDSQ